jgi:hypothetical protein
MATYPATSLNLGNTSPSNRNDTYTGEDLYIFDREQTSYLALFDEAKAYVLGKDTSDNFKDFYAGSIGSTLIELAAGFSEFNSYSSIVARRESYLSEARLIDSSIGIAQTLGYSTFRGNNVKLSLTITPTTTVTVNKFDIIGTVGNYDIISLDDYDLQYGTEITITVVLGVLKVTSVTVTDARTYDFRFVSDKISNDIMLKLDGTIVPTSNVLYDLINDKFVVLSNPLGGIDVRYLNRYQPNKWNQYTKYTFLDYVLPTYDWRPTFHYYVGQHVCKVSPTDALPIMYECIAEGTSNSKEPVWNEVVDTTTSDGLSLKWKCIGRLTKQLYFKDITGGVNISGAIEPVWPISVNEKINDGNLQWICSATYEYSQYYYNTGSTLQLTYVELDDLTYSADSLALDVGTINSYSVENTFQDIESLKEIKKNAPLYNETRYVIRGREDYRKIFQMLMTNCVDTNGFDPIPAVVELTYIKDHTNKVWMPDTYYENGSEVIPTSGNGYIYKATTSGYGGLRKKGKSGTTTPTWVPSDITLTQGTDGEYAPVPKVVDNQLVWVAKYKGNEAITQTWVANTEYYVGDIIITSNPYIYFEVQKCNTEPCWPTTIGQSVTDNAVIWTCVESIYFDGYESEYWKQDHEFTLGTFVTPVVDNGYFYKCIKAGKSGSTEPAWTCAICDSIYDNEVEWECYDKVDAVKYVKNNTLDALTKYRQYGVSPCVIDDPVIVMQSIYIDITTNIVVNATTINSDIFTILNYYQRVLNTYVDAQTFEHAIEDLSYVVVARVTFTGDTKTKTWAAGTLYRIKDVVQPPTANGYVYVANRIETGGYGYSQWTDRSYSGYDEPEWDEANVQVGDTFVDKKLTWEIRPLYELGTVIPEYWQPDTVYPVGYCVLPTTITNCTVYAKCIKVDYSEPKWPTKVGSSVLDGRIYWTCVDPKKTAVMLGWNEYYMFNYTFDYEKYTKK